MLWGLSCDARFIRSLNWLVLLLLYALVHNSRCDCFARLLYTLNWSVEGPSTFPHAALHTRISLDPSLPDFPVDVKKLQHDLRERWVIRLLSQIPAMAAWKLGGLRK